MFTLHNVKESKIKKVDPITTQLDINGHNVKFEVDTGCSVTILTKTEYGKLWTAGNAQELQNCSMTLKTCTGERVATLGKANVTVKYQDKVKQLPVVVVAGSGPWLKYLEMNCVYVNKMEQRPMTLQNVVKQNEEVFKEELGTWRGPPAKIYIKEFYKPRPVPYAMRKK